MKKLIPIFFFCIILMIPSITGVWDLGLERGLQAYWDFDIGTGVTAPDTFSGNYPGNLIDGAGWNTTNCISGNCLQLDGINDFMNISIQPGDAITGMNNFTFNYWYNMKNHDVNWYNTAQKLGGNNWQDAGGALIEMRIFDAEGDFIRCNVGATTTANLGIWNNDPGWKMITYTWNGSISPHSIRIYHNSTYLPCETAGGTGVFSGNLVDSSVDITVGRGDSNAWGGQFDEYSISERVWSDAEIIDAWNGGIGSFFDGGVVVILNSPLDNNISIINNIDFNCSASATVSNTIVNISLWTNQSGTWILNETEDYTGIGGRTNTSIFNKNISEGDKFDWTCKAFDTSGESGLGSPNRTISVDTSVPEISITYPNQTIFKINFYNPIFPLIYLNWSINDTNLDSCWYSYNGTNTTVTCSDEFTKFNTNVSSTEIKMWANDSTQNINSDTTNFSWNYVIENITHFTENCNNSNMNWTGLQEGDYTFNVTVRFNDSTSKGVNSTSLRYVHIDTTFPLIYYTDNSDVTNESANFSQKNSIFVNVSVTELNEKNITFRLWTSTNPSVNLTTYINGQRTINWTELSEAMYFWNVTICDKANNCNTTSERRYGVEEINESIGLQFSNINAELWGDVLVNATSSLGVVCVDIDHPDFGINYSCETWSNIFNVSINYFRKNIFTNLSTIWLLNYTGEQNQTMNITMHKYDEIDNLTVNITGGYKNNYPISPLFYGLNNSIIDRFFPGYLIENKIFINQTLDFINGDYVAVESINLSYSNRGEQTIYFWMDDDTKFFNFTFNISAESYGTSFFNDFSNNFSEDEIQTDTLLLGGYILPKGINLKEFTFDDFEDSSIDLDRWILSLANGYTDGFGNGYSYTINNKEENGYLEMEIVNFNEDFSGTNIATRTLNNIIYANTSKMNSWTPNNIYFEIDYSTIGTELDNKDKCNFFHEFQLGTIEVWKSHIQNCEDERVEGQVGCTDNAAITDNLIFNLTRQKNNSWFVEITGTEENWGNWQTNDENDCGDIYVVYNYTNGTKNTFYVNPDLSGDDACDDPYRNDLVALSNSFYISDLDWNDVAQVYFNEYVSGFWNNEAGNGCNNINSWGRIYYMNETLYSLSNGTFISESILDAGGDIASATLNTAAVDLDGISAIELFMSADDGDNWESVSDGVEHSFSNAGTNLRYKINMNITEKGYLNNTPILLYVNITTAQGNPSNITFDFGDDDVIDYSINGEFNATNGTITIDLSSANLNTEFARGPNEPYEHLHSVPLVIGTDSPGQLNLKFFNLTYNPNPVSLNTTWIQDYLNEAPNGLNNLFFNVESVNGTINLTDLRLDYAGGNDTIEVLAHNPDYTLNVSRNITYFYSRWDYEWGPTDVDWLVFLPETPTDTDVIPYGQSDSVPIFNLTNYGYGGKNADLSILMNDSLSCVDVYMSTNNTKPSSSLWDGLISYWSFDIDAKDDYGDNDGTVIGAIQVDGEEQDGLIAWYKFNADGDLQDYATNFTASSSNLSTITWNKSGKYSGGYKLDNTDVQNKIKFGSADDFEVGNHTFVVWVKPVSDATTQYIFDHYNWRFETQSSKLYRFTVGRMQNESGPTNSSGNSYSVTGGNTSLFEWTQLVGVYSPDPINGDGIIRMYINGIETQNLSIERQRIWEDYGNDEAQLGNSDHGNAIPFNGSVDDVRIYNRTLNADEILALYERRLETLGNAYEFDDIDDRINVDNTNINVSEEFTMSVWIKSDEDLITTDRRGDILWEREDGGILLGIWGTYDLLEFLFIDVDGQERKCEYTVGEGLTLNVGEWYHYTVLRNSTNHSVIYVNGVKVESCKLNYYKREISTELSISVGWNGSIDEVKIWNKSLTDSEISELYNRSVNKYYDKKLTDDWQFIDNKKAYLQNTDIWMWSDYSCDYSTWHLFDPYFYFRQVCEDCIGSEEI